MYSLKLEHQTTLPASDSKRTLLKDCMPEVMSFACIATHSEGEKVRARGQAVSKRGRARCIAVCTKGAHTCTRSHTETGENDEDSERGRGRWESVCVGETEKAISSAWVVNLVMYEVPLMYDLKLSARIANCDTRITHQARTS